MKEEYITIKLTEKEYELLKRLLAEKMVDLITFKSELNEEELFKREKEINKYRSLFAIMNYIGR